MKFFLSIGIVSFCVVAAGASVEKWGHRAYEETSRSVLVEVGTYRDTGRVVQLCAPAAKAFFSLVASAREDGVRLVPISGFRSVAYQTGLFERAVQRHGSPRQAARWVAPPGFSEHATGLALDVGDGSQRGTDVSPRFASTPAAQWLAANASRFGFELSFPPNNAQGVSHEPWHWRFVGTPAARAVFHPPLLKKL